MRITNMMGLPEPLYRAIVNDDYNKGDSHYSVTQLLKPPMMVALEATYGDKVVVDASEMIWAVLGQIGHAILERANDKEIVEQRLTCEIIGRKVSGRLDLWKNKITDYKFTSVWSAKDGAKPEWIQQLNCYKYLALVNGWKVESLEIVAIYRDWSKLEALRNKDYPRSQVEVFNIPMWLDRFSLDFLEERVRLHESAKVYPPLCCTAEERWEKPAKYALMKKGAKRATKLFDKELDAAVAETETPGTFVQYRPGQQVRCQSYCSVSEFCTWYQNWKKEYEQENSEVTA